MNIEVRKTSLYASIVIDFGDVRYDGGLLDDSERKQMAAILISGASELLPSEFNDFIQALDGLMDEHGLN